MIDVVGIERDRNIPCVLLLFRGVNINRLYQQFMVEGKKNKSFFQQWSLVICTVFILSLPQDATYK